MAIPAVITYAYIRGKWYAFSDQASAREGVTRYQGNIQSLRTSKPVGVLVDDRTFVRRPTSYWPDTLADAPGVTGDALINPPVNPIQGPTVVTPTVTSDVAPVVTPTVTATAAQSPSGGGNGGQQGTDYYGGPKRSDDTFIHGTNILQSEVNANLRANSGDAVYWSERLRNTDKPNDVLYEMAVRMGDPKYTASGDITGQGNPFVGKVHSGQYRATTGPTWAEQSIKTPQGGETDMYYTRNDQGAVTGQVQGKDWTPSQDYLGQFKHGEWEKGDFEDKPTVADAWKTHHLKHAESGKGSYKGLTDAEKTAKIDAINKRYDRMIGL